MPHLSSLPARVDIGDWLDEELPTVVGRLTALVPDRVGLLGLPGSYPSVASGDGLDGPGDGRAFAVVAHDDEYLDELVGSEELSRTVDCISPLIEQSESMNIPVRGF
ncbi:hypothetical protein BH09ACT8_BH09ACT8_40800 [soil metagenome]